MKRISINNKVYKTLFYAFLVVLFGASLMYAYFVNETIQNVAQRENVENEIIELSSKISEYEKKLILNDSNITLEQAKLLGFVSVRNGVKYISLGEETHNLTFHVEND